MEPAKSIRRPVRQLDPEVARKIAAGEVIDRPNAIVRELMDNAVDSGATSITVEIEKGGIEKVRVIDNGCGMSKEDLISCARPHATSKISTETDLMNLSTLGFRGEALASMAAVSRLEITSGSFRMNASITEDHEITPAAPIKGTIVQTSRLFENFPGRREFLKRPQFEAIMCRSTFEEKALPRPDISFIYISDGEQKLNLPAGQSLKSRFVQTLELFENEELFYEVSHRNPSEDFSFDLIIGEPAVTRNNRKNIYIFVNGRRIQEYSLAQAIEYGGEGFFPNGLHPVACLFVKIDSSLVDFNIHPAKKEIRFRDISSLHHAVSSTTRDFFKRFTTKNMVDELVNGENIFSFDDSDSDGAYEKSVNSEENREKDFSFDQKILNVSQSEKKSSYFTGSFPRTSSPSSYNINNGNRRSSFFEKTFNPGPSDEYVKTIASLAEKNLSFQDTENPSVDGHVTKPNYLPNPDANEDIYSVQGENSFHFVGSTLGTFMIAERNDVLYFIDQHAAHERYLYDKILKESSQKQTLLIPYILETSSPSEDKFLEEIQDKLLQSGFTCKNCGNGRWEFTTVPMRWKGTEADLSHDLLDKRINPLDLMNSIAASTACRSAVMDGDILDTKMAAWLAEQALLLPDPHCPHGRPVYTKITKKQLFTLVKRI